MVKYLCNHWPWYVAGPLIGLTVPALLIFSNKKFGISSSLQHICAAIIPWKIDYFKYNWKTTGLWNIIFVIGLMLGGFIGTILMKSSEPFTIARQTQKDLLALGVSDFSDILPPEIFNLTALLTAKGFILIVVGGFLVGFGARYANGCTAGHTIMGLSNLQLPALIATISFFIGGLIMTHLILPIILKL